MSVASLYYRIETPDGIFTAEFSAHGLCGLRFPESKSSTRFADAKSLSAAQKQWLRQTTDAVLKMLAGKPTKLLPPLDLSAGTTFQQSVWQALKKIPPGKTRTYQEIAVAIRRPKAVRAVGGACGANPIPLLVPCHRVVAANRKLGGFSGGVDWKIKLLEREGSLPTELFQR